MGAAGALKTVGVGKHSRGFGKKERSGQEPMTWSLQLPNWAYITAFLQTDLFLDYLFGKKKLKGRFGSVTL